MTGGDERKQKGTAHERALELIERAIVRCEPNLQGYTVEANHRVEIKGVACEFDVVVRTPASSPHPSVWVFECKNWKRPVGPTVVRDLFAKVNAIGASRGYIVARAFTKSAKNEAVNLGRIELLRSTDDFHDALSMLQLSLNAHELVGVRAYLRRRGFGNSLTPDEGAGDIDSERCQLNGGDVDFQKYLLGRANEIALLERHSNKTLYQQEGTHPARHIERHEFAEGELLIGDVDFECMDIHVEFFIHNRRLTVTRKLKVEGRGATIEYEGGSDLFNGAKVEVSIIRLEYPRGV